MFSVSTSRLLRRTTDFLVHQAQFLQQIKQSVSLMFHICCVQSTDSTEENNLHKDLLTSMLILLLVFIIFILLAGYFFR